MSAPLIAYQQKYYALQGASISFAIQATNAPANGVTTWAVLGANLPSGLTLNTSTGVISGIESTGNPRWNQVPIMVTTATGTHTADVWLYLNQPPYNPVIAPSQKFYAFQGASVSFAIQASALPPGDLSTTWTATNLPPGLNLNASTGVISGSPTSVGASTSQVSVTVTTFAGTDTETIELFLNVSAAIPVITPGQKFYGLPSASVSFALQATNAPANSFTTWAVVGANLPSGLTLNPTTGVISGVADYTQASSNQVSVSVITPAGTDTELIELFLNQPSAVPVITPGQKFYALQGAAASFPIHATNAPANSLTTWTATGLPAGLTLNSTTGVISGIATTTQASSPQVTVAVTTPKGTDTEQVQLFLNWTTGIPLIAANQIFYGTVNSSAAFIIQAANAPSDGSVTWGATPLPAGLTQNSATGVISGIPTSATNNLQVTVTASTTQGFHTQTVLVLIEWPQSASVVRLRKDQFSTTTPFNDVSLLGGYYVYGRWMKTGTIPGGLSWEGTSKGLRFWGTPTQAGTFIADFEGPYPPNFTSSWKPSVGASYGDPTDCSNTVAIAIGEVQEVVVRKFQIQFIVEELTGPNVTIDGVDFYGFRTYGEALSAVLRGKMVRRAAWGAVKRCLTMRSPTKQVDASSNPHNFTAWSVWSPGNPQVETAIVTAAAGITTSGNAAVIVTATGMAGSPKTISVPLTATVHTTASLIAAAIAVRLNADTGYAALFTATSSGDGVITTGKASSTDTASGGSVTVYPAPIANLNIAIANDTCAGITAATTSSDTTTGNLTVPVDVGHLVWHIDGPLNVLDPQGATAYPLRNEQLGEGDIVAADWQVSDNDLTYPREGILNTVSGQRQVIVPETSSQYATFNGVEIDGKGWKKIVDVDVPLSKNAKFFGEFFLADGFHGELEVMFWTSVDGTLSPYPLATFGLKMLFVPMETGFENYRNATPATPPPYDVQYLRGATGGGIFKTTIDHVEGRHGVYNLLCQSLSSGSGSIAHLTILAKSYEP